ncbi:hypothetical protein JY97_07705 [Alkalispirochaeta odontotermitis]|nr:hypothetical protein JY97_07705 [Alkalispirochaeta odontotermitis]
MSGLTVHSSVLSINNYLISPRSRNGRIVKNTFHLPLKGRQMKNDQPPAPFAQAAINFKLFTQQF